MTRRVIDPVVLNHGGPPAEPLPLGALAADLRQRLARLASRHAVHANGLLDYEAVAASAEFASVMEGARGLTRAHPRELASPDEQIAFWANLYNALTLHAIIALHIREGVGEVHEFYRRFRYDVGGDHLALADIEHGILRQNRPSRNQPRPTFDADDRRRRWIVARFDPRVHFTLMCGTRSCPPIRAYDADTLDAQLDLATAAFVNADVEVAPTAGTVTLSRIFHWYDADFGDVLAFVLRYLDRGPLRDWLAAHRERVRVVHRTYSWALNALAVSAGVGGSDRRSRRTAGPRSPRTPPADSPQRDAAS